MLTPEQRSFLLGLAREAIARALAEKPAPAGRSLESWLQTPRGAFVTLTRRGSLRGCIGYPEPTLPLFDAVVRGAISAALHDPRFPPVSPAELDDLQIEISVLSPLQEAAPEDVVVGEHGLVIEKGAARGLLLPQVAVEWGWDRDEFLAHTCRKAGLPHDAWQSGARLYTFCAEVFSEEELPEAE